MIKIKRVNHFMIKGSVADPGGGGGGNRRVPPNIGSAMGFFNPFLSECLKISLR